LNDDFLDLLSALLDAEVRFLIVGAYAVGVHARPRATKDLDVWVEASVENSCRVIRALKAFGAPIDNLNDDDFATPGTGFMMGAPPNRIDILTEISGITFVEAWPNQVAAGVGRNLRCPFIGLTDLIRNKRAAARDQDLVDAALLERIASRPKRT
jgi:hypothetical protein